MKLFGQLITTPGSSPASLVQNVLLGPGVTVSNILYNGTPSAISEFNYTGSNLGIGSGIVMTTGTVFNNGAGPQGPNNLTNAGVDNGAGGSAILTGILGGTQTFNAAVLEFDFIPYSDTVRFRYIFGSEEYPEFAPPNNSSYNDVFGFFISGPGITGIQNIARLPSGSIVSINNVNQITNSSFYNNNGDGTNAPYNSSPNYIQYDGFTDVLTAVSRVECGKTYHLILAIADVGDGIYDSGIFLEANSLSSNTPIEVTYDLSEEAFSDPSLMAEGCVSATVNLERGNNLNTALTIPITVSGTALEGVDYTDIPNSVTFAPGQSNLQFSLDAFADLLTEGQETIVLEFLITDACGNVNPIVVQLGIADVQPVNVTVQSSNITCPGENAQLIAVATGGVGPYTYTWNTGATTSSISVSPTSTQTFTVSVTDNCLNETATGSGIVTVPQFTPIVINESADITEICPYIPSQLETNVTGGAGGYTYDWSSDQGQSLGNQSTQIVTPNTTNTYTVVVTDQCGVQQSATILYTITSPPLTLAPSPEIEICPGDSVEISAVATGGFGQYYYLWPATGETTSSIWVQPSETTSYQVIVSDECQTFTVNGTTLIEVVRPTADFLISSATLFDDLPITFQNTSSNAISYEWSFGDGNLSNEVHPNNLYNEPGNYMITLIATDDKGCTDTISKPISIEEAYYIYVPNTFTPDGLRFNNTFQASTVGIRSLQIRIFNRWGETVFTSEDQNFEWDGKYKNAPCQDGTYVWKIKYFTNSGREFTITGHVNVIR
ncbi:MAG: choice-of-anchor L domain-containing protein [Flavobacteriales bacterium]